MSTNISIHELAENGETSLLKIFINKNPEKVNALTGPGILVSNSFQ
jgi:hypothetical protein